MAVYSLQKFDSRAASNGAFCVITTRGYEGETINPEENPNEFIGAGIPTVLNTNQFSMTIGSTTGSTTYKFSGLGDSLQPDNTYTIWLASTKVVVVDEGSAFKRAKAVVTTKDKDGKIETKIEDHEDYIMLSGTTLRDTFAMNALKSIITLVPNIKTIGATERDYYCKMAYDWASNMMETASQVRATFVDESAEATTQETEVGELENNTERLLNNLIVTLEKTQHTIIDGQRQVVSERVIMPELNAKLDSMIGLMQAQNEVLGGIKTAIENLELSPVINNNITIPKEE